MCVSTSYQSLLHAFLSCSLVDLSVIELLPLVIKKKNWKSRCLRTLCNTVIVIFWQYTTLPVILDVFSIC